MAGYMRAECLVLFLRPAPGGGLFVGLLTEHGHVEPGQAQPGVGSLGPKSFQQPAAADVIIDVNVTLAPLDEGQHVEFAPHTPPPPGPRRCREPSGTGPSKPGSARRAYPEPSR